MTDTPMKRSPEEEEVLSRLVSQLQELVKVAGECKDRELREGVSLQEVFMQVRKLRMLADMLRQTLDPRGVGSALSEQEIQSMKKKADSLPPREKKLYDTLEGMKAQCEEARSELYQNLQDNQLTLKQVEEDLRGDKEKTARRKSKFKGVGGKKGWIPS